MASVRSYTGHNPKHVRHESGNQSPARTSARRIACILMREECRMTNAAIAKVIGWRSAGAASDAVHYASATERVVSQTILASIKCMKSFC